VSFDFRALAFQLITVIIFYTGYRQKEAAVKREKMALCYD
jgi:hypothetical protein